jgi:hypothetical protein
MDAANPLATVVHYSNVVGSQSEPEISFTQISLAYTRETGIKMGHKEAFEYLKRWVKQDFMKNYQKQLRKHGIEFPIEHVIFCKK